MSERNEARKGTTSEDIAREAFSIFEQNGSQHGRDIEDWLEAERRLSANSAAEPQADGDSRPVEDDSKPRPKNSRRRATPPVPPQKPSNQEIGTRH